MAEVAPSSAGEFSDADVKIENVAASRPSSSDITKSDQGGSPDSKTEDVAEKQEQMSEPEIENMSEIEITTETTLGSTPNAPEDLPRIDSPASLTPTRHSTRASFTSLASLPWSSNPAPPLPSMEAKSPPAAPAGTSRRFGISSWLSRKSSQTTEPTRSSSPGAALDRRNTVTSMSSLSSNPDLLINRLDHSRNGEGEMELKAHQNSLKDRFNLLRLREENGVKDDDEREDKRGSRISTASAGSARAKGDSEEIPSSILKPLGVAASADPSLAPGTVSGLAHGPSILADPDLPVDWDLWQAVVYEGPLAVARSSAEQLSQAIASGIPHAIRGVVWQVLAQSKNVDLEAVYRNLVSRTPETAVASEKDSEHLQIDASDPFDPEAAARVQAEKQQKVRDDKAALLKLEKVIRRDLGARTSYSKYAVAAGLQDGLFGVCKAYALFDEGVGYAQGMNFLVMPLLFNMPEEEAFCLLVRLMNHYGLREMFVQDMPGLHLHLYQFERLLEDLEPALYCHLNRRSVMPQLYATQWFLTLFAYRFPLQLVLRIYDLILSEGLEGAILKFGIVLMQKNAEALMQLNDMSSLTNYLKDRLFDIYIDQTPSSTSLLESGFFGSSGGIDKEIYRADVLVQDACSVKITAEMLKNYAGEWEEKVRSETERETEIETLRTNNASLSQKVRSLEERTEKSDTEQVQMASDLVRTKVENQSLHDEIDSLRGQTEEYRALIDKQTHEVESRLKAEMDRIMERNAEVQNENRGLEEQMMEMEKVLVSTKLELAEINGEHESLKQKWSDLRKAIA